MLSQVYSTRIALRNIALCLVFSLSFITNVYADVQIEHDEVSQAASGKRIDLKSGISNSDAQKGIKTVRAYFKGDSEKRWNFVQMSNDGQGENYSGLLPAPDVHTNAVAYRFLVVTGADQIAKTDIYTILIDPDKNALARLQQKAPTDIKIDVSEIQEISDRYKGVKSHERITEADRQSEEKRNIEPSPDSRLAVHSEYKPDVIDVPGFEDYIDLYFTAPSEAYGVTAGIVDSGASAAGAIGAAATAKTVAVTTGGGISTGAILGGLVLAGGAAAAGGGSSSSSDSHAAETTDGSVSSRNVAITVTDHNTVQDDFFDLYVNGAFIGPVNNVPGGSTSYNVTLNSGSNLILLDLTSLQGSGTDLEISINGGEFRQRFVGSTDQSWTISAP